MNKRDAILKSIPFFMVWSITLAFLPADTFSICTITGDPTPTPPPQMEGFAQSAGVSGGGLTGQSIVVTNLNSTGVGSLKAAVEATGSRIITFASGLNGNINFQSNANAKSNMTLDGTGHDISISGFSLNIEGTSVSNIIVRNITFADTSPGTGTNAIFIRNGGHNVWIDHSTFIRNNLDNGVGQGIAIYQQSCGSLSGSGVTISWNHFADPNKKAFLIGADVNGCDAPKVSVHHNRFEVIESRSPRIHHPATVHYWNNYCHNWGEYCIGSGDRPEVLVENNIFETGAQSFGVAVQASYASINSNSVNASGNLLIGGALASIQTIGTFSPSLINYSYTLETADNALKQRIIQCAGAKISAC